MPALFAGAHAAPTPPRKRWQVHTHGRFTPIGKMGKRRLRRCTARKVYRKDAKGGAAHSVRDRLTAPLATRMRTANIQLGTARERRDRTRNGQLRLCRSTSRTILHAANTVNHRLSEANTTINLQLQAKRICARVRSTGKLRHRRFDTSPFLVSVR